MEGNTDLLDYDIKVREADTMERERINDIIRTLNKYGFLFNIAESVGL